MVHARQAVAGDPAPRTVPLRPAQVRRAAVVAVPAAAPARRVVGFRTRTREVAGRSFTGRATWYGPGFHGRRTANGERFDQMDLTAAHRTLPFGTRLRVCTRHRCVVVRVNDRGPVGRGNVLDLSRGAARRLGTEHSGVAHVTATTVHLRTVRVPIFAASAPPAVRHEPLPRQPVRPVAAPAAAPRLEAVRAEQRRPDRSTGTAPTTVLALLVLIAVPTWRHQRRTG